MPYITRGQRRPIDDIVEDLQVADAGELNYAITRIVAAFIERSGGLRYANVNEAVGALECAKLELYRRVAAPYEDDKAAENGEAYPRDLVPERDAG